MMRIDSDFDGGSIEVVELDRVDDIRLRLRQDNRAAVSQWFYFKLQTTAGIDHKLRILNAGNSTFADAWQGYQAVASYDGDNWFRVPTCMDDGQLVIEHRPAQAEIFYAYFMPYDAARQLRRQQHWLLSPRCREVVLGETADGQPISLLMVGDEATGKRKVWLTARQHPGETMAQWFAEGVVDRLLGDEPLSDNLLAEAVFYIVPNMNPDGSVRGNHRTNSRGANLNRCWQAPTAVDCPEVYHVRHAMHERGVDLFLDIHGDEAIPYNFMMGGTGERRLIQTADFFKSVFAQINRHFQTAQDYSTYRRGGSCCCSSGCCGSNATGLSLANATNYVQQTFNCLALVLEMPFSEDANHPDPAVGWSAQHAQALGHSVLEPVYHTLVAEREGRFT